MCVVSIDLSPRNIISTAFTLAVNSLRKRTSDIYNRYIPKKVQESGKCFFTTREQGSLEVTEPTEHEGYRQSRVEDNLPGNIEPMQSFRSLSPDTTSSESEESKSEIETPSPSPSPVSSPSPERPQENVKDQMIKDLLNQVSDKTDSNLKEILTRFFPDNIKSYVISKDSATIQLEGSIVMKFDKKISDESAISSAANGTLTFKDKIKFQVKSGCIDHIEGIDGNMAVTGSLKSMRAKNQKITFGIKKFGITITKEFPSIQLLNTLKFLLR